MDSPSDIDKTPPQLSDALARIDQAKDNYMSLVLEMNDFLYKYVKGMIRGFDPETDNFVMRLRHPKDSKVTGRPRVVVAQIVENLRSALDYMIFELSVLNEPDLNERVPQFIISDSKEDFERQAKRPLRYLTDEQKSLVEKLQPYNGNSMLGLLREMSGPSKHRRLLSIRDNTGLDIYFAEMSKREQYPDHFVYPVEKGQAVFARPKGEQIIVLLERFDAMPTLKSMIEHTADIVRVSFCFFQGRPLELRILRA